jgi:hypothetical protein
MINFSQEEADFLFAMEKFRIDENAYTFPELGGSLRVPLRSKDLREDFILDIQRMSIQLKKNTFQNRARTSVILARIDIGGSPHRNPDGQEIPCPHIHLYREGFDDKWAYPLPEIFSNPGDSWKTLLEFMEFCNINQAPHIEKGLFV